MSEGRVESKTILVTGGAGYVGSVVVGHLLLAGYGVVALDSLAGGGEALLGFVRHPRFQLMVGDVRDSAVMRDACPRADALVHMAAVVGEPACSLDAVASQAVNIDATRSMIDAAGRAGMTRVVYVSTCSNYGVSDPQELADEDAPLQPLGVYARSKVEAERAVIDRSSALDRTVFRFGTICGLSTRMRFDLLVNEMARAAVLGDAITVFGPDAWRPYLHIRDAARAIEWALARPVTAGATAVFNVVGQNYQKRSLVELVRRHYPHVPLEITERRPDPRDYRVSDARIRTCGGFETRFTVDDAFVEVAAAVANGAFSNPRSSAYVAAPPTRFS